LRNRLQKLKNPKFVLKTRLHQHQRDTQFGKKEWEGLKVFFNLRQTNGAMKRGMCINCHTPPLFSDQNFQNIGVAQLEYDKIHGEGSFNQLQIPQFEQRGNQKFLSRPEPGDPNKTDLGAWNFYRRNPQLTSYMDQMFCREPDRCDPNRVLSLMIGRVKVPSLRNLGHSAPYFHNGSATTLLETIEHYDRVSKMARAKKLRNPDPRIMRTHLTPHDKLALVAFLKSLDEDYE
jgi:cytochrome c peroxidase